MVNTVDDSTLESMRLLARTPAAIQETSKFGAKLNPKVERAVMRFGPVVDKYARKHDVDPELVKAVIRQESQGKVGAKSKTGVRGLMQVTKGTFEAFGPKGARRVDPAASVAAGTAYLKSLLDQYEGDAVRALIHYNSGRAAGRNPSKARFQGREYVKKILGVDVTQPYTPVLAERFPVPVSARYPGL